MIKFDIKRIINPSMLLLIGAVLIQVVALIIYTQTGVNEFNDTLSTEVLIFSIINLVIGVILLVIRVLSIDEIKLLTNTFDTCITLNYIVGLFVLMFFIVSQVNYLTNVLVSIDGTKISFAFVFTAVTMLISSALYLVSAILYKKINKAEVVVEGGKSNEQQAI